ncbi:hypothetical protein DQ04_03021070 [Trypanosoma grayi]|uniref:hypothetical protein n=1 Tax=Trypanosoma grayi TaxID=71804 RepID=UPI0004F4A1EC|nr:hypothetical protein DQ04_03021070 [Trypanosoma grayi]KEG11060.1 hypothetical protein DQ04_03021070 [Trypanosoma grayi]
MERPAPDPILLRGPRRPNNGSAPVPTHRAYTDVLEENHTLKEELHLAQERINTLEDTLSELLLKGALPRYALFLPPYFIEQHRDILAAIDVYGDQYREAVKRGLLHTQ